LRTKELVGKRKEKSIKEKIKRRQLSCNSKIGIKIIRLI